MTPREAGVTHFWDARAARYDGHYDTVGPDGYSLRARLALTLRLVGDGRGTVLDVGMGPGRLCEALAQRGWTVSGVDMSGEMVARARERLPEAKARLQQASVEQLPLPDDSFDAVVGTGVLEYTDVPRALAELARVVRPGGTAVVSYPNPNALYGLWKTRVWYTAVTVVKRVHGRPHVAAPKGAGSLSPGGFARALEAAGLRVKTVQYTSYLVLPSPVDELVPGVTAHLGARLEGSSDRIGRLLATQVLFSATKPVPEEATEVSDAGRRDRRRD